MNENTEKNAIKNTFLKTQEDFIHASFDREMAFYESICSGNLELVHIFMKPLCYEGCGILSEDKIRNFKYHMVVLASLIARYCIKGGMTPEESYTMSDFYIMKTDKCNTEKEIRKVHVEMIEDYTKRMRLIKMKGIYSKQMVRAIDYIMNHIHSRILLVDVAKHLDISHEYLSRLFRKETGITFSEYVNSLKIQEASALLINTEYSEKDIGNMLCFATQSYFIKVFKKYMSCSPKQYRKSYHIL